MWLCHIVCDYILMHLSTFKTEHEDMDQGSTKQNPSLTTRIGAIYSLYCLHQTQTLRPRVRIYVPVMLLNILVGIVHDLKASEAWDALKVLQVLWHDHAFIVGALRRPSYNAWRPPRASLRTSSLSIKPDLMENKVLREALFHVR